jgi:TonB family protein
MVHGSSAYFVEQARCARRVSLLALGLGLVGLVALIATQLPWMRNARIDTARFGFEGSDQYVRRIRLQSHEGPSPTLSDLGKIQTRSSGPGGKPSPRRRRDASEPIVKLPARLSGDGESYLAARSASRLGGVPVVRSEDLVIDRLIEPEYPPPLLDKNVEGKVTVQALVDTIGQVVAVEVLASTGETLFERAAEEAVMQCRFRPYRRGGEVSEVYAVFRFSFRIY